MFLLYYLLITIKIRRDAAAKLVRALKEFRVRGVTTNKSFMLHVLQNEEFLSSHVDTGFIAANPQLLAPLKEKDRAQKLLYYLGEGTFSIVIFINDQYHLDKTLIFYCVQ